MPSQLSTHDNDANTNAKRHLSESHVWLPIASRGRDRGRGEGRGRVVRGGLLAWGLRIGIEVEFRFDQIGGPCAPLFTVASHTHFAGTSQSQSAPCTVLRPPLAPSLPRCDPTNGDVFICLPFANQPVNNCQQGVTMPIFNYSISFALHSDPNRTTAQPAKRTDWAARIAAYPVLELSPRVDWCEETKGNGSSRNIS